jgi:hypothetical protein
MRPGTARGVSGESRTIDDTHLQMLNLRADAITSPELAENDRLMAIGV